MKKHMQRELEYLLAYKSHSLFTFDINSIIIIEEVPVV